MREFLTEEAQQKATPGQKPKNSTDQKPDADENEIQKDRKADVAANDDENRSSEEESSTGEKEQLMIKMKYKSKTITASPPDHPSLADTLPSGPNLGATLGGTSNPSNGSTVVKQKPEDYGHVSFSDSNAIDPQIKIEKNSNDQALAMKPLDELEEETCHVKTIEDVPEYDTHQQIDRLSQGLIGDDMDVDAMYALVNDEVFNEPSDTADAQAAAPETEKTQKPGLVEKRRVNDIDVDYQRSKSASPETARSANAAFADGDCIPDEIVSDEMYLDEWFPNAMHQSEDIGEAGGSQQGQDHRAIDHQIGSPGFSGNEMNLPQQGQDEQLPQTSNTGLPDLGVQHIWSQPHPDFLDPVHFTNKSASPHYRNPPVSTLTVTLKDFTQYQTPPPRHLSQQLFDQYNQPNFDPGFGRQQQLQALAEEKKRQLEKLGRLDDERPQQFQQSPFEFGYPRSQLNTPPPYVMGPLTYQRAPQTGIQQFSRGKNSLSFQKPDLPAMSSSRMPQNMSYGFNQTSLYKRTANAPVPPSSNNWKPGLYVSQGFEEARKRVSEERDYGNEGDVSDDDEPLRTRVKRHPSVVSNCNSVIGMSPPSTNANRVARHPQPDDDSDVEFVASKAKPNQTAPKVEQKQVNEHLPQPSSYSPTSAKNASPSPTNIEAIDWTLPQYEIQRQPLLKGEEIPSAKVSLPGLVREELLLSPDHADEEVHLLMNIFIPNQRALSNPDPQPAIAVLNFHTIAVMVVEAYVQYEIGDEFGTGRGHFHTEHDRGEAEYERVRQAVDADTNEIFFAVVDRYRAGLESKKKPLQLIRGTQEFCDVALDVIYHVKEHGLLGPEPKVRAVRADKGVKRGPRGGMVAEEKGAGKGTKRGTTAKPNEVQPRKKTKNAAAAVEVKKKRAKPKTLGVTVVKR
jgi:hypothetical protein